MDKTAMATAVFDKHAEAYQNKFMDVSIYGASFDLFCNAIEEQNADVLEVACGPGNITKYLLTRRPDLKILGLDLAPKMVDLAADNNPSAEFRVMDCRKINSLNKKYTGIMSGFCFPYLSKEEVLQFIKDAYLLLKSGGVLYISTMEDDYSKSGIEKGSQGDEIYMHYHEGSYLTERLVETDFTLIHTERIESNMTNGKKVTDLILIAKK